MTPIVISRLNSLRRFIDKGQFSDIDPRLQWSDDELIGYLAEGIQYINGYGAAMTYWSLDDCPPPLDKMVQIAAAYEALGARVQAEGLNNFNFSSGGVDLQWDRTAIMSAKMEDLKATLDGALQATKVSAVRTFGPGVAKSGASGGGKLGAVGINFGPMTNVGIRRGGGLGYSLQRYCG